MFVANLDNLHNKIKLQVLLLLQLSSYLRIHNEVVY